MALGDIERFQQERSLISLRRDQVDDREIQGIILAASEELILLQYVVDFRLDGLLLLRVADVSDLVRSKTDAFQQSILSSEGLLSQLPASFNIDLSNWRTALSELRSRFAFAIVECELIDDPEFALGEIVEIGNEGVSMRTFTGAANWNEETIELAFDDITSCQVDTNYSNTYQRYFDRQARA